MIQRCIRVISVDITSFIYVQMIYQRFFVFVYLCAWMWSYFKIFLMLFSRACDIEKNDLLNTYRVALQEKRRIEADLEVMR